MQEVILKISQAANIVKIVPVISTSAYVAGYTVGGIQTLTNAVAPRGSGIIHSLTILDEANVKAPFDILIFDISPSAATTTDHVAFAPSSNDVNVVARVAVATGDYATVGGEAFAQKSGLDLVVQALSGFNLYAVAVTSGTPTYTAADDLQFVWGTVSS